MSAAPPGRAEIFDGLAELYDEVRPSYPASLVDEIHERARLLAPAAILEVGCGTGKATRLFAARGHRITAVEPGPRMATLAAKHCRAWPAVQIEIARFEDWPLEERIEASGCFRDRVESVHPWTDRRSADAYTRLLRTHSDHASLPEATREALLAEVRRAIEAHGGEIAVEQEARLFFAFRRD